MLSVRQIKAIEDAFGPEKAAPLLEVFESTEDRVLGGLLTELATKADHYALKSEMAELREEVAKLRVEMAELRGEMAELRAEVREELAVMRGDMARLEGKMDTSFAELRGRMDRSDTLIKLLIGLTALAVAAFSPLAQTLLGLLK